MSAPVLPDDSIVLHPRALRVSRYITAFGAAVSMAVGAVGLAGWIFDVTWLKSLGNSPITIKTNASLGLFLAGTALLFLTGHRLQTIGRALAVLILLIGAMT